MEFLICPLISQYRAARPAQSDSAKSVRYPMPCRGYTFFFAASLSVGTGRTSLSMLVNTLVLPPSLSSGYNSMAMIREAFELHTVPSARGQVSLQYPLPHVHHRFLSMRMSCTLSAAMPLLHHQLGFALVENRSFPSPHRFSLMRIGTIFASKALPFTDRVHKIETRNCSLLTEEKEKDLERRHAK